MFLLLQRRIETFRCLRLRGHAYFLPDGHMAAEQFSPSVFEREISESSAVYKGLRVRPQYVSKHKSTDPKLCTANSYTAMHLSAHTWMRPEPLRTTLARLQRLGYSSVELAGEPQRYPVPETIALLKEYGIRCWGTVTIQTGNRDLTAPDAQQRRDTVEYMKAVVDLCAQLGGEIVTVVPGRVGKTVTEASPQDEWTWVVEALREVAAFAQQRQVRIALEPLNRFETHFLNRADQALALADAVGYDVGVAFDTFHMSIEEPDLFAAIRACGSRIVDLHTGDNNRLAAGDGWLDWPRISSVLREVGYEGGLAFESTPPIDRTPLGKFGAAQLQYDLEGVPPEQMQFIIDHGSGLLSDEYYTGLLERNAATLRPLLES